MVINALILHLFSSLTFFLSVHLWMIYHFVRARVCLCVYVYVCVCVCVCVHACALEGMGSTHGFWQGLGHWKTWNLTLANGFHCPRRQTIFAVVVAVVVVVVSSNIIILSHWDFSHGKFGLLFRGESQLWQSRTTQSIMYAGCLT